MKVVIAGSRNITDYEMVKKAIELSGFKITEVVSGGADGVDSLGERWAVENNIPIKRFPALWNALNQEGAIIKVNKWGKKYNANAGFFRNREMAKYGDAAIVIMMDDNDTPGSNNMIKMTKEENKPCFEYNHVKPDSEYLYEF